MFAKSKKDKPAKMKLQDQEKISDSDSDCLMQPIGEAADEIIEQKQSKILDDVLDDDISSIIVKDGRQVYQYPNQQMKPYPSRDMTKKRVQPPAAKSASDNNRALKKFKADEFRP